MTGRLPALRESMTRSTTADTRMPAASEPAIPAQPDGRDRTSPEEGASARSVGRESRSRRASCMTGSQAKLHMKTQAQTHPRSRERLSTRLEPRLVVRQTLIAVARIRPEHQIPERGGDPVATVGRLEVVHQVVSAQPLSPGR